MRQWQTQNAVVTMVVLGLVERKCEAKCLKCFVETARQRFETLVEKEVKKIFIAVFLSFSFCHLRSLRATAAVAKDADSWRLATTA